MADLEEQIKQAELVSEKTPRFRDALLGIRGVQDIKDLVSNQDYQPHVHLMGLLFITFLVGSAIWALGW